MTKKTLVLWLLTIFLWGASPIVEKLGLKHIEPLPALFIRTLVALIFIFLTLSFTSGWKLSGITMKDAAIISLSGILAGFLGMLTYFTLLKSREASRVVPLTSTYPLVTTILAVLILREKLNSNRLLGTLLVVLGVYLLFKGSN